VGLSQDRAHRAEARLSSFRGSWGSVALELVLSTRGSPARPRRWARHPVTPPSSTPGAGAGEEAGGGREYGIAKGLLNQAAGVDRLDYHLDQELEHLARIADGRDFAVALDAFFAKRAPHFEDI
jgi:hypothetical protein